MRIAICIPVHGDTRAAFTLCLGQMLLHTVGGWPSLKPGEPLQLELFMGTSSVVALNRSNLVDRARPWKPDWILWLDADQTFPSTTLLRLIGHGEPVVGANYPRREDHARPTASQIDEEGDFKVVWSTREKVEAGLLEPVSTLGLGVCLVSMEAIDRIEGPLFADVREDAYFFGKLRAAGYTPKVDHGLSAEVGHIRTQVLGNNHSLATLARIEREGQ
jgi:hypothetical protein